MFITGKWINYSIEYHAVQQYKWMKYVPENMDESQDNYAEWQKTYVFKECIPYDSVLENSN